MKFVVTLLVLYLAVASASLTRLRRTEVMDDLCTSGKAQSPINIEREKTACVREGEAAAQPFRISHHYVPTVNLTVANTGSTIQVSGNLGFVTLGGCNPCDGQQYDVTGFNFHAPAEHTLDGKRYAMELQIVHQKRGASDLIVQSVFFYQQVDGGFNNAFLESIDWNHLPSSGSNNALTTAVDLNRLWEAFRGEFYTYTGSLTSSPCTEGVKWYVYKTPLGMTKEQNAKTSAVVQPLSNSRSVQSVNDRPVTWYRKRF